MGKLISLKARWGIPAAFLGGISIIPASASSTPTFEIGTWANFCQGAISHTFDDYAMNSPPKVVLGSTTRAAFSNLTGAVSEAEKPMYFSDPVEEPLLSTTSVPLGTALNCIYFVEPSVMIVSLTSLPPCVTFAVVQSPGSSRRMQSG